MRHCIVSYSMIVNIEARIGYEGPCVSVKNKIKVHDVRAYQHNEVRA
jgi:hypothetical protein